MIARLRRLDWLDRAAAAYAAVYFAWLAAHAAGIAVPNVGGAAFSPLGLLVTWMTWRTSSVNGIDRRTRVAWRLLALSALILWASGSAWTMWIALSGSDNSPAWIDRAGIAHYVVAITAYLWFPGRAFPRKNRARFVLDVALIVVAGFVIAIYVGLRILASDPDQLFSVVLLESSLEWALFAVAAVGCMHKRDRVIRHALVVLLCSAAAYLVGNYVFALAPAYSAGDPVDGLWFLAWGLRFVAPRMAWHHYATVGTAPDTALVQEYRSNPFAYVLVAGAFALLFTRIMAQDREFLGALVVAALLMGGLLILRQFAELRENRRLFQAHVDRESRFRSLVQNSSDVVLIVDDGGVVTYVSPAARTVFGKDSAVAPGMMFRQLLPEDDAGVADALLGRGPHAVPRLETRMETSPGRWHEVEAVWTDLRDDPAVRGIVINCRDVTDRHEIERHLLHTQKLDAVGHVAGGLAHDLNNVLAIIRGYTESLRADLPDGSPARGDLDRIVEAVDRATGVTKMILAFSRKQPGEQRLLNLSQVVQGLGPMLRQLIKDQVDVRLQLDAGLASVRADQGQMEQVLVNLATNARDAMPDGGVMVIATANRAVNTAGPASGGLPRGDYVALTVSDEGTGMSPDVIPRIFEPFFSTKPKDRGLGLGLAIVHGIVTDMGGCVLVESVEGRGSTFTVLLPRAYAWAEPPAPRLRRTDSADENGLGADSATIEPLPTPGTNS
jgi:PAS domain S-box-containing protein